MVSLKKKLNKIKWNKLFLLILFLSVLGLTIKILFIWEHSTAFTYDQARDLLDLREMWLLKKPRLIGATTSLHGVFYGPFWYWLCFPFYLLTGGHPLTNLIPLLLLATAMPVVFFLIIDDKFLGIILALIYTFSYSFFSHSIVALNTNPIIFIAPLFLLFLAKFYSSGKELYLWLALFAMAAFFHFEPIIGIFGIPIFIITTLFFKKIKLVLKIKRAFLAFLIPFAPQVIFEFRHNFLQTKAFFALILGKGSSLTPAEGGLIFRFFDRLRVFKDVFLFQNGNNLILACISFGLVIYLIFKIAKIKRLKSEGEYLLIVSVVSLILIFAGFVLYPYALWPWYLGTVDALMLTIIGLGIYFLFSRGRWYALIALGFLLVFLLLNISKYFSLPLRQEFNPDAANLRTRLKIVDLIYEDSGGKGMNIFTFAPYVYDYPYQYLFWWRAKTKYKYLPEEYVYLPNQPAYVAAKEQADRLIPSKISECDYLIIEPYESQKEWYLSWRSRFPKARSVWEIGNTKVEKLCL